MEAEFTGQEHVQLRTLQKHFSFFPNVRSQIMFTLEQINHLHARLGKMATLLEYIQAFKSLGVKKYDSYLIDGHSEYFGERGYTVISQAVHEALDISEPSEQQEFLKHLQLHEQGKATYREMSEGLAASGIGKWTVETGSATIIYYDRDGNEMLTERIG